MLPFIIYIHKNPKILVFISNNHDQNCQTSVKNVQLFLSKQIVTLIILLGRKFSEKIPKFTLVFCLLLLFEQGFEQMLLKDAEIFSICNQVLNFEFF